jgi:hypothetical protein
MSLDDLYKVTNPVDDDVTLYCIVAQHKWNIYQMDVK